MNTLTVRHLTAIAVPAAADIPLLLDNAVIPFEPIAHAPWADDYPYQPEASFRIAATDSAFLLHYVVDEDHVAALATSDNGRVWDDSCCEFFLQPADDEAYYNIECNCMGTVLMAYGPSRDDRAPLPLTTLQRIRRWTTLSPTVGATLPLRRSSKPWQLALAVPLDTFRHHTITVTDGLTLRANFYKCGDRLPKPHYLAWNAIALPHPDFHQPNFFGKLIIEK